MSGERHEPGEVQAEEHELDLLLEYLTRTRGFSFGSYKRPSLARRFRRRMQEIGITEFADYRDYLEVHPDEYPRLFDTLLINVTAFLRDPVAWATLRDRVLPALLAGKEPGSTVRAWCAGCATGQDAYSLAMVLCEVMGTDEVARRVKIYGTDIDDAALTVARQGVYTSRDLESVPRDMVERYFERVNSSHVFRKDLRRCVIFGRHDLNADAPISKLDIVVCRNTLMYFNAEAQSHILDRFHFGLTDSGVLMLGKAETLLTHVDTFTAVDLKNRIFIKTPAPRATGGPPVEAPAPPSPPAEPRPILGTAFDNGPVPQFVVDSEGRLAFANDRARALLGLRAGDLGRPVRELELSYRPVELRPLIEQVRTERLPVDLNDVTWAAPHLGGSPLRLRVQVVPLLDFAGNHLGVAVSASDVTAYHLLEEELQKSNRELETAYEELQSTNEELETTNEELQSTIEELETTNEELQSTNEELETMNEELQSTNEELQSLNVALRERGEELDSVNAYMGSILASLSAGVVVVDRDLLVRVWNDTAQDMWGLRATEVIGTNLLALDSGLPVDAILAMVRDVAAGRSPAGEVATSARNRLGRAILCRMTVTPLRMDGDVAGAVLVMEDGGTPDGGTRSDGV